MKANSKIRTKIKEGILQRIENDNRIDSNQIDVIVDSDTISLQGKVKSYFAKKCAEINAWQVNGVSKVSNFIEVKPINKSSKPADSDDKLAKNIKFVIKLYSSLKGEGIQVSVNNGLVTIKGEVNAYWKKVKAESVIEELDGVIEIQNKLAIVHTDQVEDASLSDRIIRNITDSFGEFPDELNVNVEDSNVILTGKVNSWSEREKIYDSVLYTLGINNIIDKLEVKIL